MIFFLVYEKIELLSLIFNDLPDTICKLQRIPIPDITGQIQLKGENVICRNALLQQISAEQIVEEVGLSAAADAGDDLHLSIPHEGYELVQIAVPFDLHSTTLH